MSEIQKHIRYSGRFKDGSAMAMCGQIAKQGEWVVEAVFQGLRILDAAPDSFCPDCSREWIRRFGEDSVQ